LNFVLYDCFILFEKVNSLSMLDDLPRELIGEISSFLDRRSFIQLSSVSKRSWDIFEPSEKRKLYIAQLRLRDPCGNTYCPACQKPVFSNYFITFCNCSKAGFICVCEDTSQPCKCNRYPVYHKSCANRNKRKCILCNYTYHGVGGSVLI
jgi:hypothetical protein